MSDEHSCINVDYVCECGNIQSVNTPEAMRPGGYRNCIQVYDNCRTICLKCGKDMKLQISEISQKVETKIIAGEQE